MNNTVEIKIVPHDQPKLSWNKVPNATQYRVSMMLGLKELWQQTVTGTEIDYPFKAETLKPGLMYIMIVESDQIDQYNLEENPEFCPQSQIIFKLDKYGTKIEASLDNQTLFECVSRPKDKGLNLVLTRWVCPPQGC